MSPRSPDFGAFRAQITSVILAIVVTVGGLFLATRRLKTFSLAGDQA